MAPSRTCVSPSGTFRYGIHRPHFTAENLRAGDRVRNLGSFDDGTPCVNQRNFPEEAVTEEAADIIYEIPNPFPFRGTTYIAHPWAETKSKDLDSIRLPDPVPFSLKDTVAEFLTDSLHTFFSRLPEPMLLALAGNSTDPLDLVCLARLCCEFEYENDSETPSGLKYIKNRDGNPQARIKSPALMETLVNNPHLPDPYKEVMVLRPGVQGGSEIVGEWMDGTSHIYEYLRRNSYIPWGHYAANMAEDAIRYRISDLSSSDIRGLRHLYYQRTYVRLAGMLGIKGDFSRQQLSEKRLEELRKAILTKMEQGDRPNFSATLWGWNYGFDSAPSKYRLHASHQQIHQQFAMIPQEVPAFNGFEAPDREFETIPSFGCGDMVCEWVRDYKEETGNDFFTDYIRAIRSNVRMDEKKQNASLIVHEDENVMLFVPKAQTSQWELQLMPLTPVGNILEADTATRESMNRGIFVAMKALSALGARMVTTIEYPKRFHIKDVSQHLVYSFLPKLPESPGAFSEAQLRWINGHFPEDFAAACRKHLT